MKHLLYLLLAVSVVIVSCEGDPDPVVPLEAQTVSNLPADPPTGINPNTGQPTGTTGKFTFFSFATGEVVANSDSATTKWDLGFRSTTLLVNSGTSGPGQGGALIFTGTFDELTEAPAEGYATDSAPSYAIPTGSGNGWYNYNGATMTITPIPGRIFVIRTADGKYAKIEILSYYKDAPATPTSSSQSRYYTFRYMYQPDGSAKLK
jgi:hypothetical protein